MIRIKLSFHFSTFMYSIYKHKELINMRLGKVSVSQETGFV